MFRRSPFCRSGSSRHKKPWTLSTLEKRMMLAGDVGAAAAPADTACPAEIASESAPTSTQAQASASHLIIIDSNAEFDAELIETASNGTEIVVLNGHQDGVAQISKLLASRRGLQSVHVLSHGSAAELQLGNSRLTGENLDQHSASIAAWGESIREGGDLLLYGCNVAETEVGKEFVRRISALTGVDVAASTDRTGSATKVVGNWKLEWHQGDIDQDQLLSIDALNRFEGTLAITGAGMNLNGSASILNDELQLTSTGQRQAGTAFLETPFAIDSSTSFQSEFSFRIGGGSGSDGADGLAFLLQNSAAGADALGAPGGNLAYSGITQSLAIEFDTYQNANDSAVNTIAIVVNGKPLETALAETESSFDLNDGSLYYAWVDYNGDTNQLEVYLSDTDTKPSDAALTAEVDLEQIVGDSAYAGFSAGNFDVPNYHRISDWDFSADDPVPTPGNFVLSTSQVTASEGQGSITIQVQRVGGSAGAASVDFVTIGGSAQAGQDFVSTSGQLDFADGETSQQFTVDILDDGDLESLEQFSVRIENAVGAGLQNPDTAVVTVVDDDAGLPSFSAFPSAAGLNLNGSASVTGGELQLTGTGAQQAGTAFFDSPIAVDGSTSFQTEFSFRMGGGSGSAGADGLAFLLQNSGAGANALGPAGGYLGYDGITKSVAIEFDTYKNTNDLSGNTIAVVINGQTQQTALAQNDAGFDLNNSTQYYAWVDYNGDTNQLEVYLSDTNTKPVIASLTTQVDLAQVVGDSAFAGFSAGNYNLPNYHRVSSWFLASEAPPANPGSFRLSTSQITASEGQGSITVQVQRVGGTAGAASVDFVTIADSAQAGDDFVSTAGQLDFADGESIKEFTVDLVDDGNLESLEQFSIRIEDAVGAGLQAPVTTNVTIVDDDAGLPSYTAFPSEAGLNLNGSASVIGDELQLTGTGAQQAGTAFFDSPIAVDGSTSFQTEFSFRMGGGSGSAGADGMAFLLQNAPSGADALGPAGGYLGYDGINKSVAVEFDTYKNANDSGGNTIAVVINGQTQQTALAETDAGFDLNNGTQYYAWIDYNGDTNQLEVFLSDTTDKPGVASLTTQVDLAQVVGDSTYAGFSAGNYNLTNYHRVSSWFLTADAPPPSPGSFSLVTSQVNAFEGQGTITLEVQRLGGSAGDASVEFYTSADTAIAGEDFVYKAGQLDFADGVTSRTFTVDIIDNDDAEPTEEFSVQLDNPVGAELLTPRTSRVTIFDDDSGLPIFPTFDSSFGLNLNGTASIADSELQLTSTGTQQAGTAFYEGSIAVDSSTSFQSAFSFRIGGGSGSGGADGMTFLLQNDPDGVDALGGPGGNLAYENIINSVAIEFDTHLNAGDSAGNTLAVVINGDVQNAVAEAPALFDLNDGTQYYAWVDYNGDSDVLAVYLSDSAEKPVFALLKTTLELDQIVGNSAYAGFSAGNFNQPNYHRVTSWNLSLDVPPADPPLNPTGDVVEQDIYTGLVQPLAVEWSPDGRNIYIAEKAGVIRVARDGAATPTVLIDISDQVNNVQDRGLIDFALHPDFANNGYIYLLYTYDPPEVYDNVGNANAGPDGRGNRAGRLMRVTADASTGFTTIVAGSEEILLGTNSTWDNFNAFVDSTINFSEPQGGYDPDTGYVRDFIVSDSRSHTVGSLAFGNDGNLFVSLGDGASFNQTDVRSLRVQDIDSLSGKVLRIDPLTGEGLSDNPFFNGDADANRSKVYQLGLRNPWRLTVDPQTGQLFIGETGWGKYEEINAGGPGENFGWPFYEGGQGVNSPTPGYSGLPEAQAFYQSGAGTPAEIALLHQAGSNTIVLGDVVIGGDLGFQYDGDVFYNDLYRGIVRHANIAPDGSLYGEQIFTTGAGFVVDIQQGPDGSLYYVNLFEGTVGKWQIV